MLECSALQLTIDILGNIVTVSARCPITVCHSAQTHTKTPAYKFISVVNYVSFPFLLKYHFLL